MADDDTPLTNPEPEPEPEPEPTPSAGSGGGGGRADKGVPMDAWVTAPLLAAARSNMVLAESTLDYVQRLAYVDPSDPNSGPRMLRFQIERKYKKTDGGFGSELLKVEAPVLALLPVPALLVDEVQIDFATTVNQAITQSSSSSSKTETEQVKMSGQLSVQSDQTRKSDYRATYSFRLHASQQPATEGMNMLTDIMATAMTPSTADPS